VCPANTLSSDVEANAFDEAEMTENTPETRVKVDNILRLRSHPILGSFACGCLFLALDISRISSTKKRKRRTFESQRPEGAKL
jgi:hypothetical protein